MSPVMISIIEEVGWRTGYLILAAVSAVLVLPCMLFVIRYRPADRGMLPYGFTLSITLPAKGNVRARPSNVPVK